MYNHRWWWWFPLAEGSVKVVVQEAKYNYCIYEVDEDGHEVDTTEEQEWFVFHADDNEEYFWGSTWGKE